MKYLYVWIVLLLGAGMVSCEKGANEDDPSNEPQKTASLSKSNGLPGQIFELSVAHTLTNEQYVLQIGSEVVTAMKIDENTLAFVMPYLPTGDYFIDLKTISPTLGQVPVKVNHYQEITNIEGTYATVSAWAKPDASDQDDVDLLMEQRFDEEFAKLSEAEKKQQLLFMKHLIQQMEEEDQAIANLLALTPESSRGLVSTAAGMRASGSLKSNIYAQEIQQHANDFVKSLRRCVRLAGVGAILFTIHPLAGTAFAIFKIRALVQEIKNAINAVGSMIGVAAVAVVDGVSGQFRGSGNQRSSNGSTPGAINLFKGEGIEANITFMFGSVAPQLESMVEGVFFKTMFDTYRALMKVYVPIYEAQETIKSMFKTDKQVIPDPSGLMPTEFVKEAKTVSASALRIENISPAGLNITMEQGVNGIVFTGSSTTINDLADISFDVVYTQNEFKNTVRKTLTGTYDGREEESDNIIVGIWVLLHERKHGWQSNGEHHESEYNYANNPQISTYTFRNNKTGTIQLWDNSTQSYSTSDFIFSVNGATDGLYRLNFVNPGSNRENNYNFTINGNTLKLFSYEHVVVVSPPDIWMGTTYNYETTLERQ